LRLIEKKEQLRFQRGAQFVVLEKRKKFRNTNKHKEKNKAIDKIIKIEKGGEGIERVTCNCPVLVISKRKP
jgi:hypothetical protein